MMFLIVLGAAVYNTFLALSQLPQEMAAWVGEQGLSPYAVLWAILVFYLIFGCVMDSLSMILLTIPIFFPMISGLDFGLTPEHTAIWFGILVLIVVEVGLITPPVGMNLFVIQSMAPDIPIRDTYRGVLPFVASDLLRVALLVMFPVITLLRACASSRAGGAAGAAPPRRSALRREAVEVAVAAGGVQRRDIAAARAVRGIPRLRRRFLVQADAVAVADDGRARAAFRPVAAGGVLVAGHGLAVRRRAGEDVVLVRRVAAALHLLALFGQRGDLGQAVAAVQFFQVAGDGQAIGVDPRPRCRCGRGRSPHWRRWC